MRALNLGCGTKLKVPGEDGYDEWVNLDIRPDVGADVVRDIVLGLPFANAYFDFVFSDNVFEHVRSEQFVPLINDVDRILKVGGRLRVIVPHFLSQGAVQDPTHRMSFAPRTWLYVNQVDTPYGGRAIGITANLVAIEGPTVEGDMATEAFIHVLLEKKPL